MGRQRGGSKGKTTKGWGMQGQRRGGGGGWIGRRVGRGEEGGEAIGRTERGRGRRGLVGSDEEEEGPGASQGKRDRKKGRGKRDSGKREYGY